MKARYILAGLGAALAVALALLVLAPPAEAANDPGSGGGTVGGDWTVTDGRTYTGVSITIQNGNLLIKAGGSLTLNDVDLYFSNGVDGRYSLTVEAKGSLSADRGTYITSSDDLVHYGFVVKGTMNLNACYVSEMWGDNTSWVGGIQIYSDSVSITNSTIFNGKTGGISIFGCSPTIASNTVRDNGHHSNSEVYCFGIFGNNTKTNFSSNEICENYFQFNEYISYSYDQNPYPGEYYSHYFNGRYYYGYYYGGYWYRYEYTYIYQRARFYGTGIRLEGGSKATLWNNNIYKNGVGVPGEESSGTTVYEGYGYGTSGYWYYEGWGDHYCYLYMYEYIRNRNHGTGVYIADSTVEISQNTLDSNGFESTHNYWVDDNRVCFYSGSAITMVNSGGKILSNAIQNSAILINLTTTTVIIDGNKLLNDYFGQAGGYYSGTFLTDRVGYCIKAERSSPDILNNTFVMKFKDYDYWINGKSTFFADLLVAVELSQVKDVDIRNNKITLDCQMYGQVPAFGFNLSMLSTGIDMVQNSVEYKYTPQWSSGWTPISCRLLQLSLLSSATVENCTFKGVGQAQSGAPVIYGMTVNYGASVKVVGSTISACDYGISERDFSKVELERTTISGTLKSSIILTSSSELLAQGCTLSSAMRNLQVTKSRAEVYDSKLNSPLEFQLDKAATVNLYNTTHVRGAVALLDKESYLNVSWPVTITVLWQNEVPVEGAGVEFKDMRGQVVFQGLTDAAGSPAPMLWVKEYMGHDQVVTKLTPHRVSVSKARASSMELFIFDAPEDVVFHLIDSIAPELTIDHPTDGEHLSGSLVTLGGKASDPEAGLLDGKVEINMDNGGWVPVSAADGRWSYTRVLGDGAHVVRVKAEDLVGNLARATSTFSIDTTAPVLYIFSPADDSFTNQRTLSVIGISEERALVTVNGQPVTMEKRSFFKLLSLEDGPNAIIVVASDASGNSRTVVIHVTLDTVEPILLVSSPLPGAFTNQDPVTVTGITEPTAQVRVNGVPAQLSGTQFEALAGLSEGMNTLTVSAVDLAGNTNTLTFTVTLDTSLPDLTIFTPRDELWTNLSRVMVSGATEDGNTITINGMSTNVVNTVFSNYVTLSEGSNRIDVTAMDLAGNHRTATRTVYLDTRTPDLVVTAPADGLTAGSRVLPVYGSVDWGSQVRVNGELVPVNDFVFSTTVLAREDGEQVVEVSATDLAGNTLTFTRTVNVDTSRPEIKVSYPDEGMRLKIRTVMVTGQTEPYSTLVINTETVISLGRDGLFALPVVLEDGENRITLTATDDAGNTATESRVVYKAKPAVVQEEDLSWVLNLTGLLIGIGIAFPIAAYLLADSWGRRRRRVLTEIEAAERERRERLALAQRPTVERMVRVPKEEPKAEVPKPPEPPVLAEAPKAEAPAEPSAVKAGLKDKSGATEVSPDEIDQVAKMFAPTAPETKEEAAPAPSPEATGLKDKGSEAEGAAGETEVRTK